MLPQTVLVELSHPHSLSLLRELEHLKAIKLITNENSEPSVIPEWHKEIVRKKVSSSKESDFTRLDDAFKKLRLE